MRIEGLAGIKAATAVFGFGLALLAASPSAPAQGLVTDPETIRSCLCQEQWVSTLGNRVTEHNQVYQDRRRALETLESQVRDQRPQVNVNDPAAIEAYKRLLDQRDQAATSFAEVDTPAYAATVRRYNDVVAGYNGQCAGRPFSAEVQRSVQQNSFACPKP